MRKVNAGLMNLLLAAVLVVFGLVLLLLFLQFRKLSGLSRKETDWAPVFNNLAAMSSCSHSVQPPSQIELTRLRIGSEHQQRSAQSDEAQQHEVVRMDEKVLM